MYLHSSYVRSKGSGYSMKLFWTERTPFMDIDEPSILHVSSPKVSTFIRKHQHDEYEGEEHIDNLQEIQTTPGQKNKVLAEKLGLSKKFDEIMNDSYISYDIKRQWIQQNIRNNPNVFFYDFNLLTQHKMDYFLQSEENNEPVSIRKSFMDTEIRYRKGQKRDNHDGSWPVTMIQHVNCWSKECNIYILIDDINRKMVQKCLNEHGGTWQSVLQCMMNDKDTRIMEEYNVNIYDYEEKYELQMIADYFAFVHESKPDVCGIWNINFDIRMLYNRIVKLGGNPENIMIDSTIPENYRVIEYTEDRKRKNDDYYTPITSVTKKFAIKSDEKDKNVDHSALWDWVSIPGHTRYYCAMSTFRNLRKNALKAIPGNLQFVSHMILGEYLKNVGKLDLESLGYNKLTVELENYYVFLKYGIMDALVLDKMESYTADADQVIINCQYAPIEKLASISTWLTAWVAHTIRQKYGLIMGNVIDYSNLYKKWPEIMGKFAGAGVARTSNMIPAGIELNDTPTMIHPYVIDFDAKAMYPSIIVANNISKSTIHSSICRVQVENTKFTMQQLDEFNEMFNSLDSGILELGKMLGYPSVAEIFSSLV